MTLRTRPSACLTLALAISAGSFALSQQPSSHFTTFRVDGSDFTVVGPINDAGAIAGSYRLQASSSDTAFVRAASGAIETFNAPGDGQNPSPTSMNNRGQIIGYYYNGHDGARGFLRHPSGKLVKLDVPGAGRQFNQGTYPKSINQAGVITGYYCDVIRLCHGFVRAPNGVTTTFDAPAGVEPGHGTYAVAINSTGTIVGYYADSVDVSHGFVRTPAGALSTFDTFDIPGAGSSGAQGTLPQAINTAGLIAGYYEDPNFVAYGFVRTSAGVVTTFRAPDSGGSPNQGTFALAINDRGEVAGRSFDNNLIWHGFVRHSTTGITTLDPHGTEETLVAPGGINRTGIVAGDFSTPAGVRYGFIWTP